MNKIALILCILFLSACLPESITGFFTEPQKVTEAFKNDAGLDVGISYKTQNGAYVNYILAVLENKNNLSHEEIAKTAKQIIMREHKNPPQTIFIAYPVDFKDYE